MTWTLSAQCLDGRRSCCSGRAGPSAGARSSRSRSCRASRWPAASGRAPPGPTRSSAAGSTARSIPPDPHNAIIQDLALAPRNARGRVEYVATFALAKPVDLAKASRRAVYRSSTAATAAPSASAEGHISLVSGWQGDVVPTAEQPDDRRAGRASTRTARRSPARCSRGSSTCRAGTTTAPIRLGSHRHAAGLSAASISRSRRRR